MQLSKHNIRPLYDVVYLEDIPGSRCGPEDGPWPKPFEVLDNQGVWKELVRMARPQRSLLASCNGHPTRRAVADSINFQPCPGVRTQDRYVVRSLVVNGQTWTLTAVFDGHLGEATVEHVAHHLPIIIHERLLDTLHAFPKSYSSSPTLIAELLTEAITSFDEALANDVLALFPGGLAGLEDLTDAEIRIIINDQHRGGKNYNKARICMYGTTALVALTDPSGENLWVANVGDCQAALVVPDEFGEWDVDILTTDQNGSNESEIMRVRQEHPGEPGAVINERVLGALAPFRCLGDVPFKQPPVFTRRILYNFYPGFHNTAPWEEFLERNITPPYVSAKPEITHRRLVPQGCSFQNRGYLVLHSDGFTDVCGSVEEQRRLMCDWARGTERRSEYESSSAPLESSNSEGDKYKHSENMALRLLREVLGGDDPFRVSSVLTMEMPIPWIDDISIVVQTL